MRELGVAAAIAAMAGPSGIPVFETLRTESSIEHREMLLWAIEQCGIDAMRTKNCRAHCALAVNYTKSRHKFQAETASRQIVMSVIVESIE